ncbi:shematrin-like protein 1 [Daphnia pulicaria]|uniref:shematrin-like protein 1 n=1 Tax=Daphnia pulicaria TaxID=35523 RepID=UPI001EE9CD3F|nr:shematrin-like protein 1 [Daphnia pulicaria]
MDPHRVISTLIFLAVCCTFSLSDDSQDQAFKALADLSAVGSRRSYGAGPSSSYASYGNQYQSVPVPVPISPVTSYGYGQPQVILPKAPKAKGWMKSIFKSSNKGATSAYPSYVIPSYGSSYTSQYNGKSPYAERYGDYPTGYNNGYSGSYGSSYAPAYGSGSYGSSFVPAFGSSYNNRGPLIPPYQPNFGGIGGFGLDFPLQPPLVGSSLYGSPAYGSFYGLNYAGVGGNIIGGNIAGGSFGYGGYQQQQSYTPTLFGAFDNYRGPIYNGGFRPTLGPYGGKPFSDLLSVTDSYGRPLFPYPSTDALFAKKSDS